MTDLRVGHFFNIRRIGSVVIPKINSAHGSDTRNIINRNIDVTNAIGKAVQDLVAKGQLTPAQYATLIKSVNDMAEKSEVRLNTDAFPINVSEMDNETKQLFTGGAVAVVGENAVGNENVKQKAINESNTTFIEVGKNKFNGNYENLEIVGTTNNIGAMSLKTSSTNGKTAVVRLEPNKSYTVKKFGGGNRFRAGIFNSKITPTTVATTFDKPLFHPDDEITNRVQEFTFTNDGKGMYLYVYVGLIDDTNTIKLQVEEGKKSTDFEPYTASLKKGIRTVTTKQDLSDDLIFELAFQRNMINDTWEIGTLSGTTGNEINSLTRVRTGFIEVKAGQVIKAIDSDILDGFVPHIYTSINHSFVRATEYTTKYTVEEDCYVRLVSKFKDERQITSIEDFRSQFYVELLANTNTPIRGNKPILFGDFTTLYKTTPIEGASVGDVFDLGATVIQDIYTKIDDLMNDFPDLLKKNLIGYGSNVGGNGDTNLPIYEYTLAPPNRTLRYGSRPVKTLLMTGLHGEEKSTVWSTLHFFKQMLNNWKTNDSLASIKANMEFRWIPIANPYGFNNHQRVNARGVDPNRNFSHNWDAETASTKGPQAYSEIETRLLRDWMIENGDADFFIDFHNFSKEKPDLSYIDTMSPELQNVYTSLIRRLSDVWQRDYTLDNDNMLYGTISNDNRPMSFREAYHVAGIELSTIIEITMFWGGVKYTQEIMEMGADLIGNYFLALLNAHDRII